MDLYEYQAKELFARNEIPTQDGQVIDSAEHAAAAAEAVGLPVVVKAQVKVGGRGKAGGVKLADTAAEATSRAQDILGLDIKGHIVRKLLINPAAAIAEEYYVSFLLDRANRSFLSMVSVEGGMDIEEVAVTKPEALIRTRIDAIAGVDEAGAREIVDQAGFPEAIRDDVAKLLVQLWAMFVKEDATLVEINPLVLTGSGEVLALDGKVTLDDNAEFRHSEWEELKDVSTTDPLEVRAHEKGLNYVKLDGDVGIIGNGAGLVMSTLDVVAYAGEDLPGAPSPANFLDIGGGASAEVMANGLEIILSDPDVRSVFVNVFGGITACDAVANGIVQAFEILERAGEPVTKPVVVRLDGNNAPEGRQILADAALAGLEQHETMDGAARRVAELAAQAESER